MVSSTPLLAVVIACVAQRALSYQHLVFVAPRDWDKVKLLEYKIDRHDEEGYDPNKDVPEDGWMRAYNDAGGASFAYSLAVRAHDKVFVRVTTIEGVTMEDSHEIVDVRSEGKKGQTITWKVGSVPLFAQLENVVHADVWTTFLEKLLKLPEGDRIEEKMSSLFEQSKKDHDGWHLVIMMDHVPTGSVKLKYTTTDGKVRETEKMADRGGLFAAWSLDDAAGDLELFVHGQSQVKMVIKTTSFVEKSFSLPQLTGAESHVYILPFNSHRQSDAAWRKVMELSDSETDPFWDRKTSTWESSKLQELTNDVASGMVTAALLADQPEDQGEQEDGVDEDGVAAASRSKMVIAVSVVALVLLVSGYYFCCTVHEEDERGCSIDSATVSNDPAHAPSMLGDAWPVETVRELVAPTSVV